MNHATVGSAILGERHGFDARHTHREKRAEPVGSPERGSTAGYIAIDIQPLFRQGGAFKGSLTVGYVGTPDNRVVPQLFELAEGDTAQSQAPAPEYHTSPACWIRPRITHEGSPTAAVRDWIRLTPQSATVADSGAIVSPNNAYTAYISATGRFVLGTWPGGCSP
jgi:hypothetical protein